MTGKRWTMLAKHVHIAGCCVFSGSKHKYDPYWAFCDDIADDDHAHHSHRVTVDVDFIFCTSTPSLQVLLF